MADDTKPLTRDQSDTLLKEIRDRYDEAWEPQEPIRKNAAKNMRYVAGDPWEPADRLAREQAGRPCVSLDEINQHTNQVINDVRSNRRGVKFSPVGRGANEKSAEFYQAKMREIEYRSQSQVVYTTAFQNAVERGYGWCRVKPKYVPGTFNQELWLEEFVNPDCVLPDPFAKRPTTIDKRYCFVHEQRSRGEFQREFPDAKIGEFGSDHMLQAPKWVTADAVVVAEYWSVKPRERELLLLKVPTDNTPGGFSMQEAYADELPGSRLLQYVVRRRPDEVPYVCYYLTNGVEILSQKHEWPGQYIPLIACVGKVLYIPTEGGTVERKILGMVDLMRDPQMLYAYLRTNEAELVGMTPKTPFIGYTGQFRGHADKWASVNKNPEPYLEANPFTEATGATLLPLPMRQPYDPPIQALEILAESAIRSIRSAAGSTPLPSAAARRSEKSGVALKRIEDLVKVGSYHFVDHYDDMIRDLGIVIEDVMDKYYDAPRDTAIRTLKGSKEDTEMVRINDPSNPQAYSTKGDHLVTVSTGPSFENEQEAGSDLADSLMGLGDLEVVRAVLPLAIKLKNQGPIGDELVEIAETLQPPPVQQLRASKQQQANPQQLMAQIGQMKEQIQLAEQALQQLAAEADGKKLDADVKLKSEDLRARVELEKVRMSNLTELEKARMDNATRIHVAQIGARTKGVVMAHEAEAEAVALAHEHAEAEADRAQARQLATSQAMHETDLAAGASAMAGVEANQQRAFEAEQAAAQAEAHAAAAPDAAPEA